MPKASLVWKAHDALNTAFSAQVANVTYHVVTRIFGHPAYLEVHGPRGVLKRLDIGLYCKIEQVSRPVNGTTGPVAT
jgi:hypothetical protein